MGRDPFEGGLQHDEPDSHLTLTTELPLDQDNTMRDLLERISGCSERS